MPSTTLERDPWLARYHPAPGARARLAVLPHAGGSATYFRPLCAALAPEVEVLAVQYPGRQERHREPPLDSVDALADRIAQALEPWRDKPLALFGHSLGATVGFEVARRLEAAGAGPAALFASARPAPGAPIRGPLVHRLGDDELLAHIAALSGTDPRLLDDPQVRELALVPLRADFRAAETYRCAPGARIAAPLIVLVGDRDPRVAVDEAGQWGSHAAGETALHVFPGGHFYLNEQIQQVADLVRRVLQPAG